MIGRYEDPEIAQIWSPEGYLTRLCYAATVSIRSQGLPQEVADRAVEEIWIGYQSGSINISRWETLERQYDHDLAAFVEMIRQVLRDTVSDAVADRWHRFRTSSDLADTALALGMADSRSYLTGLHCQLLRALACQALAHEATPILGRTHGQFAEWTSIGRRFAVWFQQADEAMAAIPVYAYAKMGGPVGNWGRLDADIELRNVDLTPVPSTQIVPRSYLGSTVAGIAAYSMVLSDIATGVRLGSREAATVSRSHSTVMVGTPGPEWCYEARGGANDGRDARGSSAMPHKRNPIRSEQVTGLTRLIRSNALAVMEAGAGLWEERDISHSSVERVALVDLLHLTAHCIRTLAKVVDRLEIVAPDPDLLAVPTGVGALEALIADGEAYVNAYAKVRDHGPVLAVAGNDKALDFCYEFNRSSVLGTSNPTEDLLWSRIRQTARGVRHG